MKNGSNPSVQSAIALTDPIAYVMPRVKALEKHLGLAGWLFQYSETTVG